MKTILILALVVIAFAHEEHPVSHLMVKNIHQRTNSWKAMEPHENPFFEWTLEEIKGMLACDLTPADRSKYPASPEPVEGELPDSYDFRDTGCGHTVLDQGKCGSCWAFGASEALSDRFCLAGRDHGALSPQHMVSCDKNNFGCNGGYLSNAQDFLRNYGIPTDKCESYHSGTDGKDGDCHYTCDDGTQQTEYLGLQTRNPWTISSIKKEIYDHGSVEGGFTVYEDFMSYREGVYHHVTGKALGGHAIKIMGWGTEGGRDYWLCQNSWGTGWGEFGYFRIETGQCGIEYQVFGTDPR